MFHLAHALLKPDCLRRTRVTHTHTNKKTLTRKWEERRWNRAGRRINRGVTSRAVKLVSHMASVWGQDAMYLQLTRSKSVTSGSQPALHSYLNKPRRSRGKRETLKPFVVARYQQHRITLTTAQQCYITFSWLLFSCHSCKYQSILYISQGHRNIWATAPPGGRPTEMHTMQVINQGYYQRPSKCNKTI